MNNTPTKLTFDMMRKVFSGQASDDKPFINDKFALLSRSPFFHSALKLGTPYQTNDYRFGLITQGEIVSIINLTKFHLKKGTIVYIGPGAIVQPEWFSDDLDMKGMAVSEELMQLIFGGKTPSLFNGQMHDAQIPVSDNSFSLLKELFFMLNKLTHSDDCCDLSRQNLMAAIVNQFAHLFSSENCGEKFRKPHNQEVFSKFIRLVNEHCKTQHQIDFYAENLNLSTRHFSALIKQTSGSSAKDWIDRALISSAKVQLKHSSLQVSQISDNLHFTNVSFFCKYFKRLTGMTPQFYRES